MNKQSDSKKENGGGNPIAAVITGAVVGAGVAAAGVMALRDEKNRKKVKQVLNTVKDKATSYVEEMQKTAKDKKFKVEDKMTEGKSRLKEVSKQTKKIAKKK